MPSASRPSSFSLSLEDLRRDHPRRYRRWVLVGALASLLGYGASSLSFTVRLSFGAALATGDPFVVLADLVALLLLVRGHPRLAAGLVLGAAFIDAHFSLLVLPMPTLANIGLVVPAFVLATGLLFGGRVAFLAAGTLSVSIPTTLWVASFWGPGTGLHDDAVVHFLIVLEVALLGTTALLWAFLRSFAEILEEHRVSEARNRDLAAHLQHAQKLEALGLLAGGVAHDFNNLLTAVGGYGALLERSKDPLARDLGAQILAAQQHGATLTKQLLAFARKDIPQPRPMDLSRTLGNLTALLQRAVGEAVRLQLEAEPDCVIVADPGRIEQVMFNLSVNARDAMPNGGRLWIRCTRTDGDVVLEVEDEGVGMDEATRARVFEPFFTTKGRHQGTGLGLSTVHGIVTDSGGTIDLLSRPGRGTRFVLQWPRAALAPEEEDGPPVELDGRGYTVLLVEDNAGARAYVERLLLDRGFTVIPAGSAEEALSRVAAEDASAPDLLVCDVILPGLTGPELARRLRQRWAMLPCLFVSGYLGDIPLGDGFDVTRDLVLKPFTQAELLGHIARKVGARRPHAA
jgi:signal transduction histidine kinase/CheY-like chemotaxis protein